MNEGPIDTKGMKEGPILDEPESPSPPTPSSPESDPHKPQDSPAPSPEDSTANPEYAQHKAKKDKNLKKGKYVESDKKYKFNGSPAIKLKKGIVLTLLGETMGHIGNTCKKAGISRRSHYAWLEGDTEYKRAYEDNCEYMKDEFEYLLKQQAYNQNTKATIFFLKTQAKDRGYLETNKTINEHSGEIKVPTGINFILQPDPDYDEEKRRNQPTTPEDKEETPQMPKSDVPEPNQPDSPPQETNK